MPNYRRNYKKGGTYFFTIVTGNRAEILCGDIIDTLRTCFKECMKLAPFRMDAIVVLTDHLHCIWSLPEGDDNYPVRWKDIKTSFTKKYIRQTEIAVWPDMVQQSTKGEKDVWQKRYWEHTIRDDRDLRLHCDYIHYNPVKHGYAQTPEGWPHSSFLKYVAQGFYDSGWATQPIHFPEMIVRE